MFGSVKRFIRANIFVGNFFNRASSTQPEFAEVRFSNLKRGNYNKLSPDHVKFFESLLGSERVLTDVHDVESYNIDFAKHFKGKSEVVLRPKTTEEVSALVKFCNENNLAICPQGGNTGLVGGSVPVFDEVIISMASMNKILHLDEISGVLTCQSGCVLEVLESYLKEWDLMMPLDLGAKGTCQIGGNLSTNAGGIRLFRYGNLHSCLLGLEVVLASGEILDLLSTMKKDNTGYHLKNLFVGAEGTLGIITKAAIQCPPLPKSVNVALLGLDTFDEVMTTLKRARLELGETFSACEIIDHFGFSRTIEVFKYKNPVRAKFKFYVLLETRTGFEEDDDSNLLSNFVESLIASEVVRNAYVTNKPAPMRSVWEIRENTAVAVFKDCYAYKYDVSLPLKNFYKFVEIVREEVEDTSATLVTGYGHLGDGNLHLNVCSPQFDQNLKDKLEPFVFELAHKFGGSISAEHGIGQEKSRYLHLSKSAGSIKLMKDMKKLLDPKGILNPYKVLPP